MARLLGRLLIGLFVMCSAVSLASASSVQSQVNRLAHKDFMERTKAAEQLGRSGSKKAVKPLLQRLKSDDSELVKATILKALGRLKVTRAIPVIAGFTSDKDYQLREAAVVSLGLLGHKKCFKPLKELVLSGKSVQLRIKAIEALSTLPHKGVAGVLLTPLGSSNFHIRVVTVKRLASLGSKRVTAGLVERLARDSHGLVRAAAAGSLIARKEVRAIPLLINVLKSAKGKTKGEVERLARQVLSKLAGKNLGSDAEKWQSWWDENQKTLLRKKRKKRKRRRR